MAPFGGGLGSTGQVCGTLAGALAVIGFTLGKHAGRKQDHRLMWKISHQMVQEFGRICKPYGGIDCADIARIDWRDRDAVKKFYRDADSSRKHCVQVIRQTSDALYDLVRQHLGEK